MEWGRGDRFPHTSLLTDTNSAFTLGNGSGPG